MQFEDDTLEGAIKKAVRGKHGQPNQRSSECVRLEARFATKIDEMTRRLLSHQRIDERRRAAVRSAIDRRRESDEATRRANHLSAQQAIVPGGSILSLLRAWDRGRLRPSENQNVIRRIAGAMEDTIFPDRRMRYAIYESGLADDTPKTSHGSKKLKFRTLRCFEKKSGRLAGKYFPAKRKTP